MSRLIRLLPLVVIGLAAALPASGLAQDVPGPTMDAMTTSMTQVVESAAADEVDSAVRLLVLLTTLSLLPALLVLMTPFTRFVIIFALLRQALGLQQSPPNQVLIGLSIMLSLVVMQPTMNQMHDEALQPYLDGEIETVEAMERAVQPMRKFMLHNVQRQDLETSIRIAKMPRPKTYNDIPTPVLVTGFVLSELRSAFVIGVKVYLPFLILDIVVASVLLGMGMMMIPPVVISLPFKLLLFVLMDGWGLLVSGLVAGYV